MNGQLNPQTILDKKILIPCKHTQCQQVGIDLTISEKIIIKNNSFINVLLNEKVKLPIDVFATFTHRSSYNRKGVLITGSIYDPNYSGVVGCSIYNMSGSELIIEKNERIGQMIFFRAKAASLYQGQYQKEGL